MTTNTPELRRAIEEAGGEPPRIVDPETRTTYVLIREEPFERLRRPDSYDDDEMTPEEMSRLMWETMKEEWGDPSMDSYDAEEKA